jgi:hypothetical protein
LFAGENLKKKRIAVITIIRAHRGRDFAHVFVGVMELHALEVAPRSSILEKVAMNSMV